MQGRVTVQKAGRLKRSDLAGSIDFRISPTRSAHRCACFSNVRVSARTLEADKIRLAVHLRSLSVFPWEIPER